MELVNEYEEISNLLGTPKNNKNILYIISHTFFLYHTKLTTRLAIITRFK